MIHTRCEGKSIVIVTDLEPMKFWVLLVRLFWLDNFELAATGKKSIIGKRFVICLDFGSQK